MLSYQHGYHAGNLADVHKHRMLVKVLAQMVEAHPQQSLYYMETHAGRGVYDLGDVQAQKTGEAREGIQAMWAAARNGVTFSDDDARYLDAVEHTRKRFGAQWYAGSPHLARYVLREADVLHFFELHPQEHAALTMRLKARNVRIAKKDGYAGVLAAASKCSGAGLVLIDPSYEIKAEYEQVVNFIGQLLSKWPEVTIMLWYPLLDAGLHVPMIEALQIHNHLRLQVDEAIFPSSSPLRMKGSGMFAVNLP